MKVAELKMILAEIEEIYEVGGARKVAEDFAELQRLFEGAEEQDVDSFLDQLRKLYLPNRQPRLRVVEAIDELVVERYGKRLVELDSSGCEDQEIIRELTKDKAVRKSEANAIQHRFIQGRETWPSRKAAIEAIAKTLAHRRREAQQLGRIKGMTPW